MENQELDFDIDHVRTFLKHAFWLNYSSVAFYCNVNQKVISDFVNKKDRNGKPIGLGQGKQELFKFLKMETTYDPTQQYDPII